eukprot:4630280-Amphidinium_carterae.1
MKSIAYAIACFGPYHELIAHATGMEVEGRGASSALRPVLWMSWVGVQVAVEGEAVASRFYGGVVCGVNIIKNVNDVLKCYTHFRSICISTVIAVVL